MAKTTITQEQFVQRVLQDWAAEVENVLLQELRSRVGVVPRETINNLRMQVLTEAASSGSARAHLVFQDSARHADMRGLNFRKRSIEVGNNFILDWVKKRGVEKFKYVPGYTDASRATLSKEKQADRIASAIIASRGSRIKRGTRRRRAKWFSQNFYRQVSSLIQRLLDEQGDFLIEQTKQDIQDAFNV